jgi:hypothetical protein
MLRKQRQLRFCLLNSCDSIATGVQIHNALSVPIVAMNAPIDDAAAVRFAEAFFRGVDSGLDLEKAVELGRGVLMRLFPSQAAMPQLINGSRATIDDLMVKLNSCTGEMKADMTAMRGELTVAFEHFNARTDQLDDAISGLREISTLHLRRSVIILMLLMLGILIAQMMTPLMNAALIHLAP